MFSSISFVNVLDVPNVAVIITDGQSNVNHELTLPEARALKADGVSIITVAVGFTSETSELVGLTSPPVSENLIYVEDYKGLGKLKQKLIEPLCSGIYNLKSFYDILTHSLDLEIAVMILLFRVNDRITHCG